jgi:hypothetical protein
MIARHLAADFLILFRCDEKQSRTVAVVAHIFKSTYFSAVHKRTHALIGRPSALI